MALLFNGLQLRPQLRCARPTCARQLFVSRRHVHARRTGATSGTRSTGQPSSAVDQLADGLRLLEAERDEAVRLGEECARSAVKLEEMVGLLERLAFNKVQEGDDDGARRVLEEKASVLEVLSRTSQRATVNLALASKLAEKIGQQQAELMGLLQSSSSGSSDGTSSSQVASQASSSSGATPDGFYSYERSSGALADSNRSSSTHTHSPMAPSSPTATATGAHNTSASPDSNYTRTEDSSSSSGGGGSSSGGYEAPWERNLREARERVAAAEAQATAEGRAAAWKARETVEEARERLRRQAFDSVAAARSRIKRSASESIAEAQARIASEDAAALAEVHKVIDRYKAGGYVSEAELDWAFAQLEKRSWR